MLAAAAAVVTWVAGSRCVRDGQAHGYRRCDRGGRGARGHHPCSGIRLPHGGDRHRGDRRCGELRWPCEAIRRTAARRHARRLRLPRRRRHRRLGADRRLRHDRGQPGRRDGLLAAATSALSRRAGAQRVAAAGLRRHRHGRDPDASSRSWSVCERPPRPPSASASTSSSTPSTPTSVTRIPGTSVSRQAHAPAAEPDHVGHEIDGEARLRLLEPTLCIDRRNPRGARSPIDDPGPRPSNGPDDAHGWNDERSSGRRDPRLERRASSDSAARCPRGATSRNGTDRLRRVRRRVHQARRAAHRPRAASGQLVIPEFERFRRRARRLFDAGRRNTDGGRVADYIPQLGACRSRRSSVPRLVHDRRAAGSPSATRRRPSACSPRASRSTTAWRSRSMGEETVHTATSDASRAGRASTSSRSNTQWTAAQPDDQRRRHHERLADPPGVSMRRPLRPRPGDVASGSPVGNEARLQQLDLPCPSGRTADRNFALGYFMREKKCLSRGNRPGRDAGVLLPVLFARGDDTTRCRWSPPRWPTVASAR